LAPGSHGFEEKSTRIMKRIREKHMKIGKQQQHRLKRNLEQRWQRQSSTGLSF